MLTRHQMARGVPPLEVRMPAQVPSAASSAPRRK